jgi:hypothetical protein
MDHCNRLSWSALVIALLLFVVTPAFADIQLYVNPPTLNGSLFASQNDTGGLGNFATVYDDFQIYQSAPYYLDDVEWFGGYWNGSGNVITGWTITLYADNAGQPGSTIWSRYFDVSYPGYMESGNLPNGMRAYDIDDIKYGYKLMPFTTYWLSVVPDLAFPPQWGWGTGVAGDGISYQDFLGVRSQLSTNFAMNIQGVVPEPGTLLLLGTAVLGVGRALRRR